jgi:hypothetical protein
MLQVVASATPVVSFKAAAVPIAGFKGAGNIYGAGAGIRIEYTISGTEYGGYPPPLEALKVYLPHGAEIHPSGFPACPISTLEPFGPGPSACPKGSAAGPVGKVLAHVAFGKEVVPEEATLEPFYAPSNGLSFYIAGHSPVSFEDLGTGGYTSLTGSGGPGPELVEKIPLVETVPGAQDASYTGVEAVVGSAYKQNEVSHYYTTLPQPGQCPTGGLPFKSELVFAGLGGLSQQTVVNEYKAPCPKVEVVIDTVQFKATVKEPEIVVSGDYIGSSPPSPSYPPPGCPTQGTGKLFGGKLYFVDETGHWEAGKGGGNGLGSCIGLVVPQWSNTQARLKLGNAYNIETTPQWTLNAGDKYKLHLYKIKSGLVSYSP